MASTLIAVLERKETANLPGLERRAAAHRPRGFAAAIRKVASQGPAIIAELKHASPSRGVIREDYRPAVIAKGYEDIGAAALSVLTDGPYFQGSLEDLLLVSDTVKIPCLCKDFILDPFQILEARANGADAILLIVAAHDDKNLMELFAEARRLSLDVLCEVHTRDEVDRAVNLGFEVIGVNSRDLATMTVSPLLHKELVRFLPTSVLRVAESGIRTPDEIESLLAAGYDAFLIGESLMRQPDPSAQLALLLDVDYASEF